MADVKISALPAVASSLGTDLFPVDQGGTTKKVTTTQIKTFLAAVTTVTGTAPVVSSGGLTPAISMHVADTSHNGYLLSTDWNTFTDKGVNASLIPAVDNTIDLGSSSKAYANVFVNTLSATGGDPQIDLASGFLKYNGISLFDFTSLSMYDTFGETSLDGLGRLLTNSGSVSILGWTTGLNFGYTKTAPSTGFSSTIADSDVFFILDPAGTLATGTITMPANPDNGQVVGICSTHIITALTIQGNTGQTIANTITTLPAGGCVRFLYSGTKWYRISN